MSMCFKSTEEEFGLDEDEEYSICESPSLLGKIFMGIIFVIALIVYAISVVFKTIFKCIIYIFSKLCFMTKQ